MEGIGQVIPEAAIEAALNARLTFKNQRGIDNAANLMRHILEAAAPHMRFTSDLAGAAEADRQLVRDIAGVDQTTAESLGY